MNKDYNHASDAEEIQHVGVSKLDGAPVGSGRYPLGSGENPNQHLITFDSRVKEMRDSGMNDTEIARYGYVYNRISCSAFYCSRRTPPH